MKKLLGMTAGIKIDNNWWCISRVLNDLYKINLDTEQVETIYELPEKNNIAKQAYTDILYNERKLYFVPAFAQNIAVFNIDTCKISKINISEYFIETIEDFNIGGGVIFRDWLLLYPCLSDIIIRINLKTLEIDINDSFIYNNNLNTGVFAYHKRHCQIDNIVYVALATYDGVLCIDIEKFKFNILNIKNNNSGYSAITIVENELWLAPHKIGDIVKYRLNDGEIEKFGNYPQEFKRNNNLAYSDFMYDKSNNIYLVPFMANMFLKINRITGLITKYELVLSSPKLIEAMDDLTTINIHSLKEFDGKYYLSSESLNCLIIITKDMEISEIQYLINIHDYKLENSIIVKEIGGYGLDDFLSIICL